MRVTTFQVVTPANAGRTYQARTFQARYFKPIIASRRPFCARCSPSPHSTVAQSTRFHRDGNFGHIQSDGGGRGGVNNYFDRWWNSDGKYPARYQWHEPGVTYNKICIHVVQVVAGLEPVCRSCAYS